MRTMSKDVRKGQSIPQFSKKLLMIFVISLVVTTIGLFIAGAVSQATVWSKRKATEPRNQFWRMVASVDDFDRNKDGRKTPAAQLAEDLKVYLNGVDPGITPNIVIAPFCRPDAYPNLADTFGKSIFDQGNGGCLRNGVVADIRRFQEGGVPSVVREELRMPIPIDNPAEVKVGNDRIRAYNHLWQMIAGTKPLDTTPAGKLAADLRDHLKLSKSGKPSVFTEKVYCEPGSYPGIEGAILMDVFEGQQNGSQTDANGNLIPGEDGGFFKKEFLDAVEHFRKDGLPAVTTPSISIPFYGELRLFDHRLALLSDTAFLFYWLGLGTLSFLLAGLYTERFGYFNEVLRYGFPNDWRLTKPEGRGWKLIIIALVPQAFLLRAIYLIPILIWQGLASARTTAFTAAQRWWKTTHHPYRNEREVAHSAIRRLERLPVLTQRAKEQLQRARDLLASLDELTPTTASSTTTQDHSHIADLVAADAEAMLNTVQAMIDAEKEIGRAK